MAILLQVGMRQTYSRRWPPESHWAADGHEVPPSSQIAILPVLGTDAAALGIASSTPAGGQCLGFNRRDHRAPLAVMVLSAIIRGRHHQVSAVGVGAPTAPGVWGQRPHRDQARALHLTSPSAETTQKPPICEDSRSRRPSARTRNMPRHLRGSSLPSPICGDRRSCRPSAGSSLLLPICKNKEHATHLPRSSRRATRCARGQKFGTKFEKRHEQARSGRG